jgi:hypothetical protein
MKPTVTFYTRNDEDIGGEITVIVFDAGEELPKERLECLLKDVRAKLPFGVGDAIWDPPERFATGFAYKSNEILDARYLPILRTVFQRVVEKQKET